MCIGCGPFTADTDLDYKPWSQLLKTLKTVKPAVLLLVCPAVLTYTHELTMISR